MIGWPLVPPRSVTTPAISTDSTNGANTLADSLGDVRAQVNQIAPSLQGLIDAFSSMRSQYGGDKLVRDVETAAKLVRASMRSAMRWA